MNNQIEPIYLVAKNVIQQANNQFKNVHILNNVDNIPPQFVLQSNKQIDRQIVELKPPPLPYRSQIKSTINTQSTSTIKQANKFNDLKQQSIELYENLKEFFELSTELRFRLVILFIIYISIIYNLYRSLSALYLIESNFRSNYHYLTPNRRTIYSIFMLFNLFIDCYGVYTLLKKNIVNIFFYAIALTGFSLFLLICFGALSIISVLMSLSISSICYLFTYVEYKKCLPKEICQHCVHHINHI